MACDAYQMDLTAAQRECKTCGYPKLSHSQSDKEPAKAKQAPAAQSAEESGVRLEFARLQIELEDARTALMEAEKAAAKVPLLEQRIEQLQLEVKAQHKRTRERVNAQTSQRRTHARAPVRHRHHT